MGPNTGALAPRALQKAGLGVGCGRGSSPLAARVRGYHPRKIWENSDAKSYILVTTMLISGLHRTCIRANSKMSCFLKTTAKKLETNTLLVPHPKSWGTSLPRFLWLLRLCSYLFTCLLMSAHMIEHSNRYNNKEWSILSQVI